MWVAPDGYRPIRANNATRLSSAGAGEGTISNQNSSSLWVVVQLSVITSPTASGAQCTVAYPTGVMDTAYFAGTGDVAGGEPEFLYPDDFLTLQWTNGPADGQGIATYMYYEIPL